MKYINNHYGTEELAKINLQLFAEDPEIEEEEEPEEEPEEHEGEENPKKKPRMYTKKEMGAIVAAEVKKAVEEYQKSLDDEKSEAEKLKNMTAEQKREYDDKKKDERIRALELRLAKEDMRKTASASLKESGLDATEDILDFVVGEDADITAANIKKFIAIKDAIVLSADKARNTGTTPKVTTTGEGKKLTKADIAKMSYKDVLAYKNKHPEEYKKIMED